MAERSDPGPQRLPSTQVGEAPTAAELDELLDHDLRDTAERLMRRQPLGHTLQPTALVNEAYIRLMRAEPGRWHSKDHFLAAAARAMRSVLVDHARRKRREKRRGTERPVPLDRVVVEYERKALDLVALDDSLEKLAAIDPEMARAVELRFFGGFTVDQTARFLDIPKRTLERRWKFSVCWLRAAMQ